MGPDLEPRFGTVPSSQMADELARFKIRAAFVASLDEDNDPPSTEADIGDSNYEVTVLLDDDLDDSQFELPAITQTNPSRSETWSVPASVASATEPFPPDPRYYDLIDSWSRICFLGALGLGALSLVVIGVVLARILLGGQAIDPSTTILILGFVGTIAFLLISFTMTALNLLLVDLARNTRRLRIHADRDARIASE
jgi:hypothetical protein